MRPIHILVVALCFPFLCELPAQDIDKELSEVASKLATLTRESGKKKVAVLDFLDLDEHSTELGRYVAEQLTVNLVMVKSNFSVLDRANLNKILKEHKLAQTGAVDPESAKKLGQFAGVDAIIVGNVMPKGTKSVGMTAKIIATDTTEIVGAAKAEFRSDDELQKLVAKSVASKDASEAPAQPEEKAKVSKSFGNLQVDIQSLKVVNGGEYLLTLTLTNTSKKSIWSGISCDFYGDAKGVITDSGGLQFPAAGRTVTGIALASYSKFSYQGEGISGATEIRPGESLSGTMKFYSKEQQAATVGKCNLQLEIVYGENFKSNFGKGSLHNLVTKIEAD